MGTDATQQTYSFDNPDTMHKLRGGDTVPQGWQCPVCGRVWAWWKEKCDHCDYYIALRESVAMPTDRVVFEFPKTTGG